MANLTHLKDKVNNREIEVQQSIIAKLAKQIENVSPESGSYQEKPFLFQGTGTDSNTTETPTAPVAKHLELRGNTVVFNQLVDANTTTVDTISGHKYLTLISGVKSVITSAGETLNVAGGTDIVIDLTKMFGSGKEPTTVIQFNRLFPLPYYAYNAGQLLSCQSNKLVTIGYNQFNAQDEFIKVVAGQTYRLMYWNGTTLTALTSGSIVEYAGDKTSVINTVTYDNLSDLPNGDKGIYLSSETQYIKITGSSNTNILFNLAWDGSRSDYQAYEKHEYTLPNEELKSVPYAYDSQYPDGRKVQKINSVDLGTLNWFLYNAENHIFGATISDKKPAPAYSLDLVYTNNIRCGQYDAKNVTGNPNVTLNVDKSICELYNSGYIYVRNNSCDMVEDIVTALSGVTLYYELATPITTQGTQFTEQVQVDDFGTMEFTTSETESASNPIIPQGNQFFYPADYVLLIDDLNNYTDGDVGNLALKSDLTDKANKVTGAVNGNLASLDANGNLTDSGKNANSFAPSSTIGQDFFNSLY